MINAKVLTNKRIIDVFADIDKDSPDDVIAKKVIENLPLKLKPSENWYNMTIYAPYKGGGWILYKHFAKEDLEMNDA